MEPASDGPIAYPPRCATGSGPATPSIPCTFPAERSFSLLALALLFAAAPGCAYLEARGNDFLDCFKASVGYGVGIESHVQVGPAGLGAGLWFGVNHGIEGRKAAGTWGEWNIGIPVLQVVGAVVAANGEDLPMALHYGLSSGVEEVHDHLPGSSCIFYTTANYLLWPYVGVNTHEDEITRLYATYRWVDYFWISCSVKVFVGAKLGFNVAEFLDFLLGFAGIDICGDDGRPERSLKFPDPEEVGEITEDRIDRASDAEVKAFLNTIGALLYGKDGRDWVQIGFLAGVEASPSAVVGELESRGFEAWSYRHAQGCAIVVPVKSFYSARKALLEVRDGIPGLRVWERETGN